MTSNRGKASITVLALCFVLTTAGCGSGEYHRRMEKRLTALQGQSKYLEYLEDVQIDVSDPQARKLGVFLQPPKDICSQGIALRVGYVHDNVEVAEHRVKPPFLMGLRDFCLSYELLVPNPDTRRSQQTELPIYLYFAVSPVDSVEQDVLLDEIRQALVEAKNVDAEGNETTVFPDVPDEWEDVTLPAEGGKQWKRLRLEGEQLFASIPKEDTLEGKFDIYVHSDDNYHVVVAFRAPTNVDDKRDFMRAGEVSLETLRIEPPPTSPGAPEPADDSDAAKSG